MNGERGSCEAPSLFHFVLLPLLHNQLYTKMKKTITAALLGATVAILSGCSESAGRTNLSGQTVTSLEAQLMDIVNEAPGTVGIAFVGDNDTVLINNGARFPMMSVFKLHQALAVADALERKGATLDSLLVIRAADPDRTTWSPMLKTYGDSDFTISAGELVNYALVSSDNNASNILFDRIVSPSETDTYVKSIAADTTFIIRYSESEMKNEHRLSYLNHSSPLSAALLIGQIFNTRLFSTPHQEAIKKALTTATTGQDRLCPPLAGRDGVVFGHKTGSGYRNENGELVAFNDVAYISLPDGRSYCLAVMIRDFTGSETEAAAIMARISETVLRRLCQDQSTPV